jgi:hypothetical protein
MAFYVTLLFVGPMLGSLITEPAAMTIVAMILAHHFYHQGSSESFKYATIALLFVNISIGGTLTHFAAPPIVMVATKWGWDTPFMLTHFGYKAVLAMLFSTLCVASIFRAELKGPLTKVAQDKATPVFVTLIHLMAITLLVFSSHHLVLLLTVLLIFLAWYQASSDYQNAMDLKPALMVGIFLAGLVYLGQFQAWWIGPLVTSLSETALFWGAVALTGITDNAALTYLGSLVDLNEGARYALATGAVTGGGLTVIANAPNPAGYGILKTYFKDEQINPLKIFLYALGPTLVAALMFLFF